MTSTDGAPRVYALSDGVRVFLSGEEIRFRKGVWSYNEAIVALSGQEDRVIRFFTAVHQQLAKGVDADVEEIGREVGANSKDLDSYCEILDRLKRQQFLHDPSQRDIARVVSALLGGNLSGFEEFVGTPRPILFFSDSSYATEAAKTLAKEVNLPLDVIEEEILEQLSTADLTSRTDAIQHMESATQLGRAFNHYACVLGAVASPNVTMLRNLNRLLVQAEKPLILGLIDGPFISMLATLAPQSGCFECFEQRVMARLEDTVVYHQFVEKTATGAPAASQSFSPPMHILTATVISEGYLYATLGMLRLAGRIVNIYLPLLEIQVQDLLRVPYCPACGFVSKAQMNEMYTSSKRLVDEMLTQVEVED